ncbi:EF-hand calcium-binding domain-containing protein 4A-like [Zootermopsis nevadensis]|uniref:EF-hand calcium-binding domain-containing protein 4B n=1 Tax=Zootermopsis nevadensis TaxID=136037 RepID=A0A067RQE0_ZOONE|nr:EF-hand calcium-binding domain-containing protein 4A-like [Zootermopsis nevadensis]XP_021942877.1 EF-hand calcium-binding domain-containing protein 4A-like [Zootermopsis nevadensis]XP_021942878.1 EF-hand calcium-binding domain-containing protein 4A-like [Zootermopsis nevadensis]KDR22840.1 EF-hand calcium-binding domain-containing protein 4B [Zootermopsis nevadensis]
METATSRGTDRMEALLEERAQQLFLLSDRERKGFIVKRDMQRMRSEIPLTPEQLEAVFDSLDVNNNGYLTIEQFLSGFGEFVASHSRNSWEEDSVMESSQKEVQDSDGPVQYLLRELESINVLHNLEVLRQLCHHVEQEESPLIRNNLETFLQQLVTDLRRCQKEQRNLEEALKLKDDEHDAQVRRLFEEMETQLHEEKKNQARHVEQKLQLRWSALEQDLAEKEQQLQDVLNRQQGLTERVHVLRSKEMCIKEENERLLRAKEELEAQLQAEHREVMQVQRLLDDARQNEAWERRRHLSAGFRLAKRIMLEQRGLIHQLQLLQQMTSTLEGGEEEQISDRSW